jgi:hypothetical protein
MVNTWHKEVGKKEAGQNIFLPGKVEILRY